MVRKLIIFPGNFLPHIGGLETHVDEFVKFLSRDKNYKITIFSPDVVGAKEKEVIHNNVEVIRYPAFEAVRNFPFPKFWKLSFYRLFLGLYKNDYDIVMTRTRFFSNSTLGIIFAKFRFRRLKLVHVEHGSDFVKLESRFKSFVAKVYDRTFGWLNFKLADKSVAISDAVHKFVKREFERKKTVPILRRGVDFDIYDKKHKRLLKEFDGKSKMLFVGRLYKWKGVKNSIEAYKSLPESLQKKSVLVVVGDGEDMPRLKKSARGYLGNGIYLLGKRSFEDCIDMFLEADVYVHSAFPGGGLSNSLLQAMYCRCAIIASPHEGAAEVINSSRGILLKDNSVKGIEEGMEKMISSKILRDKCSKNAKEYAKTNFSWEKAVDEYKKVFDEVLR